MNECPQWNGGHESTPNKDTVANLCTVTDSKSFGNGVVSGHGSTPWTRVGKIGSGVDSGLGSIPRQIETLDLVLRNKYDPLAGVIPRMGLRV